MATDNISYAAPASSMAAAACFKPTFKEVAARARQYRHPQVGPALEVLDTAGHRICHRCVGCIAYLGPVDGDDENAMPFFEQHRSGARRRQGHTGSQGVILSEGTLSKKLGSKAGMACSAIVSGVQPSPRCMERIMRIWLKK